MGQGSFAHKEAQDTQDELLRFLVPLSDHQTIHERFERQAATTPGAIAVSFNDEQLTYRELNARANRLAHHLRGLGVGPETCVGILVERSLGMVVTILGVLKAGGCYLPLDPAYPMELLSFMLEDARASFLLASETSSALMFERQVRVLCLDRDWEKIAAQSTENLPPSASAENLAYVIYTSGSTGQPKGVAVSHANVARLFDTTQEWFGFDERDVWTLFHSCAFDFSVWELWGALLYGGRVVVVPFAVSRDPLAFHELLRQQRVTVLNQTPSAFWQLSQAEEDLLKTGSEAQEELALRLIIFGGEALELQKLKSWVDRHGDEQPQIVNMYGITETTVHVTYRQITRDDLTAGRGSVIGRALPDLQLYLLDNDLRSLPADAEGEIYVGGAGVARGYLNRPDLTAERFVPDPLSRQPGRRLYRTGDLAREVHGDDLEYQGRADEQVKVRGFRIEPGEVNAALARHSAIRESVVLAREDARGEKRLVAYCVCNGFARPASGDLHEFLKEKLPSHMIPSAFVFLDALPLTPNGKIDRKLLPVSDLIVPEPEASFLAPRTNIEQALAEVWAETLGLRRVGIDDNYFVLGGDSILSIRVRAGMLGRGFDFSLEQLFRHPTIRGLAEHVKDAEKHLPEEFQQPFSLLSEEDRRNLPAAIEDAYPVSRLQAGMVFHSEYSPDYLIYISSLRVRLPLDIEKLQSALDQMANVHEMLRTSFALTGFSEPLQLVHRTTHLPLLVEDLRHLSPAEEKSRIAEWITNEMRRRFDWAEAPLLRFHLHLFADDSVQFTMSEPFFDGWSVASFFTEFFERYVALLNGKSISTERLAASYRDFVSLEREALHSEQCRNYWATTLAGAKASRLTRRPFTQSDADTREVLRVEVPVSAEVSAGLKRLAQFIEVPLKSVLMASHLKVLSLLTGQPDVVTGLLINGRPETADGERILGAFLNTVPLRLNLSGATWADLAQRAYAAENELLLFRRYPIQELQRVHGAEQLFDTVFNYTHFHVTDRLRGVEGLEVLDVDGTEQTYYPLTVQFNMDHLSSRIELALDYRTMELGAEQAREIAGYYSRVLAAMSAESEARHEAVCLLSDEEQRRLLVELNETAAPFAAEKCVQQLFEEQVERAPDAIAVRFGKQELSYGELNVRANKLARYLRRLGVAPEVLVGIFADRSLEALVGLLAILKAGGAYLPLDPEYPRERIGFMMDDSHARVILTQSALLHRLPEIAAPAICLDTDSSAFSDESSENLPASAAPDNLVYVIYTSGSTGRPKGVLVAHRGVTNMIEASLKLFAVNSGDRVLQGASLSFDASVLEIFMALLGGATLHLASREVLASGTELGQLLRDQAITTMAATPSLLDTIPDREYPALHTIIAGGEACTAAIAARLSRGRRLFNAYAPTEATVYATTIQFAEGEDRVPPLGWPIANMQVYVLDQQLRPVPIGITGEIHVGGIGLARGYLNQSALTAERFVPDSFSSVPGARLYKTGDLARFRAGGEIEFVGRVDQQVKLRGFRIELGEIETVLNQLPSVREAVVFAREDAAGAKRLIAYVVAREEPPPVASEMRDHLKRTVPEYMVPSAFVVLKSLPLTATGKVDRKALPEPEQVRPELAQVYVAPQTAVEEVLCNIFSEVLQVEPVGVRDSFFELGGHSLLATQISSRVRSAFQVELPLRRLFESPTVEQLAEAVLNAPKLKATMSSSYKPTLELSGKKRAVLEALLREQGIGEAKTERIPRRTESGPAPLSFAQQRIWFLDQLEPENPLYNIHTGVELSGPLNVPVLQRSIAEIIRRHEALRTTFAVIDDRPVQVINQNSGFKLPVHDLQELDESQRQLRVSAWAEKDARLRFDLTKGLLLRATLLRLGETEHVLLLSIHHIVSDGWSVGVFVRELAALYEAYTAGRSSPLPELSIQYADFGAWQRDWLQGERLEEQLSYWRAQLSAAPPLLALPTDRPRPPVQSYKGAHETLLLSESLNRSLKELSRGEGATLFMTLLAAFSTLLCRYSGQRDILVGTPIANRNRAETESLIGFFVNTLIFRTRLSEQMTFRELLGQVRETALEAYAHQDLPFEKLVEELQPERSLSHSPVFQVMLDLQNAPMRDLELQGLRLTPLPFDSRLAKFDLILTVSETEGRLSGQLEYNVDLFDASTIRRMARHLEHLLETAVSNPDEQVSRLPLLTDDERRQILFEWNDTQAENEPPVCIHELFAQQAAAKPQAVALAHKDEQLTYRQLNERANKLAHHLRRLGTGSESVVGVCLARSVDAVVAILGVLKAGGAYLPLDPSYPRERLSWMLADAGAQIVITEEFLERNADEIETQLKADFKTTITSQNLAYVIYTSGSTGKPKGVLVSHRNLAHSTLARFHYYQERLDSFLLLSPFAFDSSVAGLFWTLCRGGMLVIPEEDSHQDSAYLAELIERHSVSHVLGLPALYEIILREARPGQLASLRTVIVAGEPCPPELAQHHAEILPHAAFFNEYGPTEASVWSSVHRCDWSTDQNSVPIGRPVANTQIYVLDSQLQPVPIGVTGEVYIGGEGVARGYLNHPDQTAERFVPNAFSTKAGARCYRTGDLARFLADGNIEYIGRNDFQVKIRGYRIELSEIELALVQHSDVREAVVLANKTNERLTAYVVLKEISSATTKQLRDFLKQRLPEYMLPTSFVVLDALPLTATGKVDRNALPLDQIGVEVNENYLAPRTPLEQVLAGIFSQILSRERVSADDSFFDLGGHSLLATQILSRVREAFQLELPLRKLFRAPTVAGLAAAILEDEAERERVERTAELLLKLAALSEDEVDDLLAERSTTSQKNNG